MSDPTAANPRRSAPDGPGRRRRKRAKVLLWRATLGAASGVGALAVTVVGNRLLPLF
ncbi:hypothetical protein [Streptomyces sp. NRRL S-378]|uniref:hypothetical protein n=1 Tax=Streptomyces sp. NRRL S-378 TaxID=1463904 RepID=UPI00131E3752|nr:hypothetical protein [Streptomyces sp. NRRL S-378]